MSYQVLARKWRPRGFDEVVGQDHVVRALSNALLQNRLHHAYLFTGTRGVGKTTLARILAKCLNCETGITAAPCEACETCISVNEGRFVDLIEVDGASRTKVEDTRELLDNVQYAPVQGRVKIYLIDEVHMLSTHSFNALLKTLEEPPPYVKFLLATTDPQKVPVTILSRCLQFTLKQLTPELIAGHLQNVLEAEHVPFDEQALLALGRAARGSVRDALSLTDQAIAYGAGEVRVAHVQAMLGTVHQHALNHLFEALVTKDAGQVLEVVEALSSDGVDLQQLMQDMLSALYRMTLAKTVPAVLNQQDTQDQDWLRLAEHFSVEALQVYYQIALLGLRDLQWAPHVREGVEMLLLRMMLFDVGEAEPAENHVDHPFKKALNNTVENSASSENDTDGHSENAASSDAVGAAQAVAAVNGVAQQEPLQNHSEKKTHIDVTSRVADTAKINQASEVGVEVEVNESDYDGYADICGDNSVNALDDSELPHSQLPQHDTAQSSVSQSATPQNDTPQSATPQNGTPQEDTSPKHNENAATVPVSAVSTSAERDVPPADLAPWLSLIETAMMSEAGLVGPALNLARNCVLVSNPSEPQVCQLEVSPGLKMLLTENAQQRLTASLEQAGFARVTFQVTAHERMTPSQWIEHAQRQAQKRAITALQEDPFVCALQTRFEATLRADTVRPLTDIAELSAEWQAVSQEVTQ